VSSTACFDIVPSPQLHTYTAQALHSMLPSCPVVLLWCSTLGTPHAGWLHLTLAQLTSALLPGTAMF
jgi:hypothetical protein